MHIVQVGRDGVDEAFRQDVRGVFVLSSATARRLVGGAQDTFFADWAGCYLDNWPDCVYAARSRTGRLVGYLTGCPDTTASAAQLAHIDYMAAFADWYSAYPAHFHVNCHPNDRGHGLGTALVGVFVESCRAHRLSGVHVVTASESRNRSFYRRCGFELVESAKVGGRALVLLGLAL